MREVIVAGGCFWCIEADYKKLKGVTDAVSGYTGGPAETANYDDVCSGASGHVEAVKVSFDENIITFREIIDYFWTCIDPTNPYGQFADIGKQYQTVIYYKTEEEKTIIEHAIKTLDESYRFEDKVATRVEPVMPFYPAEAHHQNYYKNNPIHYENYRVGSGRSGFIKIKWSDKRGKNDN